ncbi:MAG: hypothetical protein C5B47_01305 [Verrucomicrobia bacterium]|nr:MAG: hypothetical protein C5B47_01305 [Verrucomicrobiota bacterium]
MNQADLHTVLCLSDKDLTMQEVTFSILDPEHLNQCGHFASVPLSKILKLSSSTIKTRWIQEMKARLAEPEAIGIIAEVSSHICGLVVVTSLPWDSAIIGKRMSSIRYLAVDAAFPQQRGLLAKLLEKAIDYARCNSMDFLLCKTDATETDLDFALINRGFAQMDTLLHYVYKFGNHRNNQTFQSSLPEGFGYRLAVPSDFENLAEVTRASFSGYFGRFHTDPHIGHKKATKIYEEWIRSCLNGWTDWTSLVTYENQIVGYCSWKKPSSSDLQQSIRIGHCSIIGIHPDYFRRGLSTFLISEGMRQLMSQADYVAVLTHANNLPAQGAFRKLGWNVSGKRKSYHKWLNE